MIIVLERGWRRLRSRSGSAFLLYNIEMRPGYVFNYTIQRVRAVDRMKDCLSTPQSALISRRGEPIARLICIWCCNEDFYCERRHATRLSLCKNVIERDFWLLEKGSVRCSLCISHMRPRTIMTPYYNAS